MKRTSLVILAVLIMLSVACGGKKESPAAGGAAGKPLVIAFDTSPTNLDSRVGNDQGSGRIFDMIYSGLVKITPDAGYEPDLAERWETPDDRTIVFHLKEGAKFQDGRPVTARDVKWTYESLMVEAFASPKKSGYATVTAFEAPDDKTFIIRLTEPNAGIFDNLTLGILPQGADTNVFKSQPVGAGPYRVTEFRPDDRVALEAFEGFHGGAPKIKQIVVRIIPDATTRILELRKGSVDFALNAVPYDTVPAFEKDANFKVVREPGAVYQYLAFNLRDKNLAKQQVREAIAMSIDRARIVRDLLRGYGQVTDSLFPVGHWARAENLASHPFDLAKAKSLLDAAGLRDPDGDGPKPRFSLAYKTSTDTEANQQAEIIQQMLKQVGIDVQIQSNEFGVFYEDIQKGNFQLFSLRRAGVSDPDFLYVIFHSASFPPEGQNRGSYRNAKMDQLIVQGRSTFDQAKRKESYVEAQKILAQELPYVSLYHRDNVAIMKRNLEGFKMYPSGFLLAVREMEWK
ncbi:MAG: ABC transporter substrate-binding protein [Thermoanaerobaculia bacterium]